VVGQDVGVGLIGIFGILLGAAVAVGRGVGVAVGVGVGVFMSTFQLSVL
jgi:hypothetical protein